MSKPDTFKTLEKGNFEEIREKFNLKNFKTLEQTALIKDKDGYTNDKSKIVKKLSSLNPALDELDLELAKEILDLRGVEYDSDN